jgi:hypothetical protein
MRFRDLSLMFCAVLLARVQFGPDAHQHLLRISIVLLECCGAEEDAVAIDIVNAEFFDEESLLIVYRCQNQGTSRLTCSAKRL